MSEAIERPLFVSNQVGKDPYSVPLETIDVADFELFETDQLWGWFKRLREEDPVHWNELYETWFITRYDDLVWLTRHPELFSNADVLLKPTARDF